MHVDVEEPPPSGSQCEVTGEEVRQLETQDVIQHTQRDVTRPSARAIENDRNSGSLSESLFAEIVEEPPPSGSQCEVTGEEVRQLETQDVIQHTQRDVTTPIARAIENASNSGSLSESLFAEIVSRYLNAFTPSSKNEFEDFLQYLQEIHEVVVLDCHLGSLVLTVECNSLEILDKLWEDYHSGHLDEVVQQCLVSDDILDVLGLTQTEAKVKTFIDEEEYKSCRQHFFSYQGEYHRCTVSLIYNVWFIFTRYRKYLIMKISRNVNFANLAFF